MRDDTTKMPDSAAKQIGRAEEELDLACDLAAQHPEIESLSGILSRWTVHFGHTWKYAEVRP